MPSVNVLYQSDDNYARYMGVSLYSLLKNNKETEELNVVIVDDHISEENKGIIARMVDSFGRRVVWIDADWIRNETLAAEWPKYNSFRKNTNCFLKYFIFDKLVELGMERIMYIDSDSIVVGPLGDLFTMDMDGKAIGMTRCCLVTEAYRKAIGFDDDSPYFNAGMNLFDVKEWAGRHYPEKLIERANTSRVYSTVDQDLLNFTVKGDVLDLGLKYNYQCMHEAFRHPKYSRHYHPYLYYDDAEVESATNDRRIVHFMRFCGEYPWNTKSHHPSKSEYESYRAETEWANTEETISKNQGFMFKMERLLYVVLPASMYLRIFKAYHGRMLLKSDRKANSVSR